MAISLYFGLPGAGKTTLMVSFALKALRHKKYQYVYCNVPLQIPGLIYVPNQYIGIVNLHDGLVLIDEATLYADSRDFARGAKADFTKEKIQYFLLHRHYKVDIFLFSQQWDSLDRRIRTITDRVFYCFKPFLLGRWFTYYYRIPYGIIIPDGKHKGSGEHLGEIIQGYCKPDFLTRLFCPKFFRPKYYKYFDSWDAPVLPELQDLAPQLFVHSDDLRQDIIEQDFNGCEQDPDGCELDAVSHEERIHSISLFWHEHILPILNAGFSPFRRFFH